MRSPTPCSAAGSPPAGWSRPGPSPTARRPPGRSPPSTVRSRTRRAPSSGTAATLRGAPRNRTSGSGTAWATGPGTTSVPGSRTRSVTVTLRNTSARASREVVQVYLSPADAGQPVRLVGWAAADVPAGDTAEVVVPLRRADVAALGRRDGRLGPSRRRRAPRGARARGRPAAPARRPERSAESAGRRPAGTGHVRGGPAVVRHDHRQPRDHLPEAVAHRHGDAGGLLVDVARQQGEPLAAHLGHGRPQLGPASPMVRSVYRCSGRLSTRSCSSCVAVGEQDQTGRRHVQRQPAGDPREVDDGVAGGQPLDEQHLVAVPDAELGVVPDHGVQVLQERHGRLAQRERGRRAGRQLPHAHPDPDRPVGAAGEQPVARPARPRAATPSPRAGRPAGRSPTTGRAGSSGVKQSRIRTARASEDSPVAVRAMRGVWHDSLIH